jgi:DNA-binding transcriptional regulator YdaS (Cro superfamily)
MQTQIIQRAITAAGGLKALADAVGVSAPSIIGWRRRGEIPADRLAAVSAATGIPAAELRPDLAAAFATEAAQ